MKDELKKINIEIENAEINLAELRRNALKLDFSIQNNIIESNSILNKGDVQNIRAKLEEKEQLFQKTEEFFNVGRWIYYFESKTVEWSDETYKIFEYPDDFQGSLMEFYMSCIDDETASRLLKISTILTGEGEDNVINQSITTPLGNKKLLSFSSSPIKNDAGEVIAVEGLVKDLSDKITGKNGLDKFFNLSHDLHCIVHKDRYFLKVSPSWSKLLGYTEKELLTQSYEEFIHPDDIVDTQTVVDVIYVEGSTLKFENRYIKKSGEVVYLNWNSQVDTETELIYCSARDVTESKLAKEKLLSDLSEKELLLREIHHRVKNNLQIISSLLSLQSKINGDEKHLSELYQDSQNRIQSMAAIHEMFYQSDEIDKIDFGLYMNKLIADLSRSFSSSNKVIDFNIVADPIYVNLDTAIPLGLLVNEVVTNSIKHGCDTKGNVKVFATLDVLKEGSLQLLIGDHGVNSLDDILNSDEEGLGILLINSLVDQIDGEIEQLNNFEGTVFKLIFKNRLNREI
ncbi:PAS domain S-box protein [Brumimicrobium glaciale]|uniref:histidine kinase n=1 Tax=Brumimicrobium glaciale TaxID=200475 RepID=A0A4Q4KPQ2_9FLAO|nr:histidine kinase dimerization/phosphoacceptor domain -containing protein [Brumimicrobium glaciale]RYM35010.1 PAS domain S-box protein [Brumimicrobium glaciale]